MSLMTRSYSELIRIPDFMERYRYLRLGGKVGEETFGWERYLNQRFYTSSEWRNFRRDMIVRDFGCDLGVYGHEFADGEAIFLHHINPICAEDIARNRASLMDPENVICCRKLTHDAIHYGDESLLIAFEPIERRPNDTCPWKIGT